MKNNQKKKSAALIVVICVVLVLLCSLFAVKLVRDRAEAERIAAVQAAALAAEQEAQAKAEQERLAAEAEAKRLEEERLAAEQAKAEFRARSLELAAQYKETVRPGDVIGTVWVEGTNVSCDLYWDDTMSIFRKGAGCSIINGCVMPGENGTVFVGAHTDSYFNDLFSAEVGAIIHLDTLWGDFQYKMTEGKVIYETEVDQCRWGETTPSCILYTCYPQGIQTPTDRRYLVYADPVETDENGVVPQSLPEASPAPETQG